MGNLMGDNVVGLLFGISKKASYLSPTSEYSIMNCVLLIRLIIILISVRVHEKIAEIVIRNQLLELKVIDLIPITNPKLSLSSMKCGWFDNE